ncbi:MAG: OB-fold nucleic acid binding domain-containing protein [Actinomycetota bacterium]|nr:OB-fold nucleic acid binding domain-containing protein [Actinomycetota bacterium]
MALKDVLHNLTTSMSKLDNEKLQDFCANHANCSSMGSVRPREEVSVVGEITTVRIVPRAGSPSLEATITDGTGSVVAAWTGRRRIAGIAPGKRLMINGRGAPIAPGGRLLFFNPRYELL